MANHNYRIIRFPINIYPMSTPRSQKIELPTENRLIFSSFIVSPNRFHCNPCSMFHREKTQYQMVTENRVATQTPRSQIEFMFHFFYCLYFLIKHRADDENKGCLGIFGGLVSCLNDSFAIIFGFQSVTFFIRQHSRSKTRHFLLHLVFTTLRSIPRVEDGQRETRKANILRYNALAMPFLRCGNGNEMNC